MVEDDKIKVTIVRPDIIPEIWDVITPFIKGELDENIFTSKDGLKDMLMTDKALMLIATVNGKIHGFCVLTIENLRYDTCNIFFLAGDKIKLWQQQMNKSITEYAREMGCDYIVALGNKGWQRVWPDFTAGKILYSKKVA